MIGIGYTYFGGTLTQATARPLRPQTLLSPEKDWVTDRCIIALGSDNKSKIDATLRAFRNVWPAVRWSIVHAAIPIDREFIPIGGGETQTEARNRASFALSTFPQAHFGVGIESGLFRANKRWFECTWIVVHDRSGTEGLGASPSIEISGSFARRLQAGEDMGNICKEMFDEEYTNDDTGYFGVMTSGGTNRVEVYTFGIMPALARFNHPEVFEI
jgi:inosine/xanthosine triphosphatase